MNDINAIFNEQFIDFVNLTDNSIEDLAFSNKIADFLISKYDYLDSCVSRESFNSDLNKNLVFLLKFFVENGSYLDKNATYKEQMDMFFSLFRNLLRNNIRDLPESVSLLILKLIETRAAKWNIKPSIEDYYANKLKNESSTAVAQQSFDAVPKRSYSLKTSKSYGDIGNSSANVSCQQGFQNKGLFKNEVVIKNSDSGKVMGIKGRRVHMIEELSDTVISLQKTNHGAKERLVQISGHDQTSIEKAKKLIDATIKLNTSPTSFNQNETAHQSNCFIFDKEMNDKNDAFLQNKSTSTDSLHTQKVTKSGHKIELNLFNKKVFIQVEDKQIGQSLEQFIRDKRFVDHLTKVSALSSQKLQSICYDRAMLLKLQNCDHFSEHVINDVKHKHQEIYRP